MQLNHARLLNSLTQLAQFGKVGTGVNRLSFTSEDRAGRQWLVEQMREAGLDAEIDGIGNVYGRTREVDTAVADRLAYRLCAERRLAGWRHGGAIRPGGRPDTE